ncbi:MAG: hypothetical protein KZQ93_15960 [Candidatus Thiodiazotropha sp. (ex Monitilora ramsayi)]|nr:hypothetical protein [Candidatus Thiodiazotropha sp. (ex Monitilora ramsayi)]
MEERAGDKGNLYLLKQTTSDLKARIRREQLRWANRTVATVDVDLAMAHVADVLEAEREYLMTTDNPDTKSVADQLAAVCGYLRQQVAVLG